MHLLNIKKKIKKFKDYVTYPYTLAFLTFRRKVLKEKV